jgi:methionine-S-sulfoxide reductase
MPGVITTRVGYAGGTKERPTYRSMGDHTECVQVVYDPSAITYDELLDAFFGMHEPTRSAHSVQYESLILTHDETQARAAQRAAERWEAVLGRKLTTRIEQYRGFANAEDYHQKYALRSDRSMMLRIRAHYPDDEGLRESTAAARLNGYLYGAGSPLQLEAEVDGLGLDLEGGRRLSQYVSRRLR